MPPQSLTRPGGAMKDRTPAGAARTRLSPAVDPSILAWSTPGTQDRAAGVSREQIPDVGDVVGCCLAHRSGPGAHKPRSHVGKKLLLSER